MDTHKVPKKTAIEFTNCEDDTSFALALQLQEEDGFNDAPKDDSLTLALKLQEDLNRTADGERGAYMVPLEHGVVLFKNCLNIDQQAGLYQQCLDLAETKHNNNAGLFKPSQKFSGRRPGTGHSPMMNINWGAKGLAKVTQPLPPDLRAFAIDVFEKGKKNVQENASFYYDLPKELRPPNKFQPDALNAIFYPDAGTLYAHQDGAVGWVLSVSIGSSAIFAFSKSISGPNVMQDKQQVRLDSGDVVLFNGQVLFHAIEKLIPNSAPRVWGKDMYDYGFARFNLQFRDLSS